MSNSEVKVTTSESEEIPSVELKVNIHNSGGFTLIQFNRPMLILKLTKKDAKEFARKIMMEALK